MHTEIVMARKQKDSSENDEPLRETDMAGLGTAPEEGLEPPTR